MPEEKRINVVNKNIPTSGLGLLAYAVSRFAHDINQLASGVKGIFNPVFTPDTEGETPLEEGDALSKESEPCKEPSLLAGPSNAIFTAEDAETLNSAKIKIAKLKEELLNEEAQQKTPYTQLADSPSAKIRIQSIRHQLDPVSRLMSDKIRRLVKEGNDSAKRKARLLAEITKPISMLLASNLEHEYYRKNALIQAIATIRKSILDNQRELSNYSSKWGSSFFFGKILRIDLGKRVASKILIDSLTTELDEIENQLGIRGLTPRREW
ncbi:hypothetical protein [Rickettsiella endosymbiont of Dermanyssus gallinae]|uniref:hypothetical protein n=1 Tax=Rickettsiella endosymbiont of Dermanyssus gallinae TaxID=2856608 RepID=UPI001C532EB0|nr:hypothetical protein [Rickettsiella endosymbiont of Dermanyssus gallinae]